MKILLVDDHPIMRTAVAAKIKADIADAELVEAATVAEAVAHLGDDSVDVVSLDLRLEDESGLDIARHITASNLRARCVVFTSISTPQAKLAAFDTASVVAFLEKGMDASPLVRSIRAAADGFSSLTLAHAQEAAEEIRNSGDYDPTALTTREREIVELVADGHSDSDIAAKLFLAASTIRNHLTSIYAKIGVDSRTRLAALVWDSRSKSEGL